MNSLRLSHNQEQVKTIFEKNIMLTMLTLKRRSETDAVVTQENLHPKKM